MIEAILNKIRDELTTALITNIPAGDLTRAGIIKLGPLQGDPDPDEAVISVEIYENDPDAFYQGMVTGMSGAWQDEVLETEIGGIQTIARRGTVKARCILEGRDLTDARDIASTIRSRIEKTLRGISFVGISVNGETVTRRIYELNGEMLQAGGPPTSYDFHIKVRFELWTTTGV